MSKGASNVLDDYDGGDDGSDDCSVDCSYVRQESMSARRSTKGIDHAVIKTGSGFGKFIGTDNKLIKRDPDLPIRCTVQYYKVTDTPDIGELVIRDISEQITKQYSLASDYGSLVTEPVGTRITENKKAFSFGNMFSMFKGL